MRSLPKYPALDGFIDLADRSVDMRPTLLRVLTDLYVQSPSHTPEDERCYTELALRLLHVVDIPARAAVAKRLASHANAPNAIIQCLARDVRDVSEPILLHSVCLTPADLAAIAKECGAGHAATIAKRGQPDAAGKVAAGSPAGADANRPPGADATELCELFYAAGAFERRLILLNLDYSTTLPVHPPAAMQRTDIWPLESAVLQHNSGAVVRELERSLGISQRQAQRIVEDELGEPIVVAAKAMNMPADVLHRVLLLMNPAIGQSVDRVYELAELYREMTLDAGRRLIAILRAADLSGQKAARHQPLLWSNAAENARQALAQISHRALMRRGTSVVEPPARANRAQAR